MEKLREVIAHPSALDSLANYSGELPDDCWYCVLTRSRDSTCMEESNFEVALQKLGGESEDVRIDRFSHWACGWWESLSVKTDTEAFGKALEIESGLNRYAILDEIDYSERCREAAFASFYREDGIIWLRHESIWDEEENGGIDDISNEELMDMIDEYHPGGLVDFCGIV